MSGRKLLLDSNIVIYIAKKELAIETLLSVLFRFPIQEVVVQKVIALRQTRRMKLPDAIIAATAILHDCVLVTRNISDFSGLPGLAILNPFDL